MSTNLASSYTANAGTRPWQQPGQREQAWDTAEPDTGTSGYIHAVPRSATRSRPRVVYALVTVIGLFAIVVTQLLLSVGVSEGAYQISGLEAQQKTLSRTSQDLSVQLDSVASPQNLAANAEALGMVRNTNPSAFLRLSDGKVLGVPAAAKSTPASAIGAGSFVPNALLKGVAPVSGATGTAAGAAATGGASLSAPPSSTVKGAVPLQSGLPSPTTR